MDPFPFLNTKGKEKPAPLLAPGARIADTHCHLGMLEDAPRAIAHAALLGVDYLANVTDAVEDAADAYAAIDGWFDEAQRLLDDLAQIGAAVRAPEYHLIVGVHPHNAKDYSPQIEAQLAKLLDDPRTVALGEIGLDYHYDFSPREDQRRVFARQLAIARERDIPVALHLREAHGEALELLRAARLREGRVLVHCCNIPYAMLEPFLELGCSAAFGGPVTFGKGDEARESATRIPVERMMTETDSPYMTPAPLRGVECTPAHTVFTAAKLCELRGFAEPDDRQRAFLDALYANARAFFAC